MPKYATSKKTNTTKMEKYNPIFSFFFTKIPIEKMSDCNQNLLFVTLESYRKNQKNLSNSLGDIEL